MLPEAAAYKRKWQKAQRARLKDGCVNDSFVYLHLNADDDLPHHVGMGDVAKRPWEMKASRSSKHKNKTAKHGVRVELISDELTWENAQWWEVRWIKALKAVGFELTNLTDGGDDQPMRHQEVRDIHRQNISRGENHYTKDPNRTHPMELSYVKESHLQATNTEEFKEKQRKRMEIEGNPMDRPGARENHANAVSSDEFRNKQRNRILIEGNILDRPGARENYNKVLSSSEYKIKRLKAAPKGNNHYSKQSVEAIEKQKEAGKRLHDSQTLEQRVENAKKGWVKRRRRYEYWGA